MASQRLDAAAKPLVATSLPNMAGSDGAEKAGSDGAFREGVIPKPPHDPNPSVFLVEAAEVETRLRQHVLELLEPTIRKQGILEKKIKEAMAVIDARGDVMDELRRVKERAESLYGQVDHFREELAGWDKERRAQEQVVGDRLSLQETEINALRQSIDFKADNNASVNRALKGLGDLLASAREETVDLRRYCVERIDLSRDKFSKLRDEFEMRMMAAENQIHRIQDAHVASGSNVTQMQSSISLMNQRVDECMDICADVQRSKASVTGMEELQQDLTEFIRHMSMTVSSLKAQFSALVEDVKDHMQTAAKVAGVSVAEQMDAMREEYQHEVSRINTMRRELDDFTRHQKQQLTALRADIAGCQNGCEGGVQAVRESVADLARKGHANTQNVEVDLQQLRKCLRDLEANFQAGANSRHYGGDVLAMLVESAMLAAALDMADDTDRKSIALFGSKGSDGKQQDCSLPGISPSEKFGSRSARTPRKKATATAGSTSAFEQPVVTIDRRCLSCSGSSATVLAGFKLACLSYAPSPVEYEKITYSRTELIRLRMDLLRQAKDRLRSIE